MRNLKLMFLFQFTLSCLMEMEMRESLRQQTNGDIE